MGLASVATAAESQRGWCWRQKAVSHSPPPPHCSPAAQLPPLRLRFTASLFPFFTFSFSAQQRRFVSWSSCSVLVGTTLKRPRDLELRKKKGLKSDGSNSYLHLTNSLDTYVKKKKKKTQTHLPCLVCCTVVC